MGSILEKTNDILSLDLSIELDKAEDLGQYLDYLLLEVKESIKLVTVQIANAIHIERKVKRTLDYLHSPTINASNTYLQSLITYYQKLEIDVSEIATLLKSRLDTIKQKLEEIVDIKLLLYARSCITRSVYYTPDELRSKWLNRFTTKGCFLNFQYFEEHISKIEAEALMATGLIDFDHLEDEEDDDMLDADFKILEGINQSVDDDLAQLRAKMNMGGI